MSIDTDWLSELYEPDRRLDDAISKFTGVAADLHVAIGGLTDRLEANSLTALQIELARNIFPLSIPARQSTVTAAGGLTIADPEQLGPKSGTVWDVRRVSVTGLASTTETVTLWKVGAATATSAQAQNFVVTLTGPTAFQPFGLGQLTLRANESLMVTGASLTVGEVVTLSADGIAVGALWMGLYLL